MRTAVALGTASAATVALLGLTGTGRPDVVGVALTGTWACLAGLAVLLVPHRLAPLPRRWRLGGAFLGVPYGVGQLVLAAERAASEQPLPFPSAGDLISFLAAPGWFVVLLLVPRPAVPAGRLPRVLADAGVVAAAVALLAWRLAFTDIRADAATVAAAVATALLELMILALVAQLAVVGRQRAVALLSLAVALIVSGDLAFSAAALQGGDLSLWSQQVLLSAAWPLVGAALLVVAPPRPRRGVVVEAAASVVTTAALALCAAGSVVELLVRDRGLDTVSGALVVVLLVAWTARELVLQRQRVRQVAALSDAAHLDPLTGLANRRALSAALAELGAGTGPVGVVVIDLDGFKRVNDTLGHSTGDALVVAVGRALRRVHPGAVAARLGGDEFALVLQAPAPDVLAAAERLAELVRETAREVPGVARVRVSASAGVVVVDAAELGRDGDALAVVARASSAMQEAKRRGRDRVVLHAEVAGAAARRGAVRQALTTALETGDGLLVRRQALRVVGGGAGADGEAAGGHLVQLGLSLPDGPVTPEEVDDVARHEGLDGPLARRALQEALLVARRGSARVWVRVGTHLLHDGSWPALVAEQLERSGARPSDLVLELVGAVSSEDTGALAAARSLAEAGVGLAAGVLGEEPSLLGRIQLLPLTLLVLPPGTPAGLRSAVVASARELGLAVVSRQGQAEQAVVTVGG